MIKIMLLSVALNIGMGSALSEQFVVQTIMGNQVWYFSIPSPSI